ncbi:MAG: glycosyltransferase family 4 protein [Magnetospirillum sp. WYHS-4]
MTGQADARLYEAFFEESSLPYCDIDAARAFLADAAAASPFAQRALIEQQILPLFRPGTPQTGQPDILGRVATLAREGGLAECFAAHDARILAGPLRPFVEAVNRPDPDGCRRVLFVATTPYFVILREAMYLRRNGHKVFLLSLSPLPQNLSAMFAAHFDGLADTRNSFRLMRAVLAALRPDVVHVQCWMWMYVLGRLAIESCPDAAVVCEFYDATSLFAAPADMAIKWDRRLIDFDITLEAFILRHADAVVSRYSPAVAAAWAERQGARPRYLEFQPYPCPEFGHPGAPREDGPIRLVYAGSFLPPDKDHPPSLFPEVSMPGVFRSLLDQGFAVDIYHPPQVDPAKLGPQFEPYRRLERECDRFRLLPGIAPDRFAEAISGYDYGIHLFDFDPRVLRLDPLWMQGVMPTRFFSYLEAGLPGIVIAEYGDMTRLLEDHGMGLGLPAKDIPRLAEVLGRTDRDALAANVRRYNEAHGMDKEIFRLIGLYDEIIRNR